MTRERIAEAVHQVVSEYVDDDNGYGRCLLYSVVGGGLLRQKFHLDLSLMVGVLKIKTTDDLLIGLDAESKFADGNYHCWLQNSEGDVIDFSARHYLTYCAQHSPDARLPWKGKLSYIWFNIYKTQFPNWLMFSPRYAAENYIFYTLLPTWNKSIIQDLIGRAYSILKNNQLKTTF